MKLLQTLAAKLLRAFAKRMKASFVYDHAQYPLRARETRHIDTPQGRARALFYWPLTQGDAPLPVYLNLHGGGFLAGVPEHDDSYCQRLAHNLGCLVVNLDYVLAPEHPFPAGLHQCFAVLEWLAEQAPELGIDPWRMAVGGHSAGGNLATGVAALARGHRRLRLVHQVIDYAALDLAAPAESKTSALAKPLLRPGLMNFFMSCYFRDPAQAQDPLASPALAEIEQLRGLPPATLITAEYDVLRAEGQVYAAKLRQAGVVVAERTFAGCDHMFTHLGPDESAEQAWQLIEDGLREAFADQSSSQSGELSVKLHTQPARTL
ncbi:alpha/beta hydrolase [Pseudomonas indica]|uniref:alpha/beta hydrolase n=1 Tax=Pseudomonas indica TaxID=137658 RepID=UPI000BABDC8B|nr:alpha/beta hydrolase [Pseudomonas indica]